MKQCDPFETPPDRSPEVRLVQLETLVTHLQYDVEQLNAAVVAQQDELRALRDAMARLERRFDADDQPAERRDPIAERPPHY